MLNPTLQKAVREHLTTPYSIYLHFERGGFKEVVNENPVKVITEYNLIQEKRKMLKSAGDNIRINCIKRLFLFFSKDYF